MWTLTQINHFEEIIDVRSPAEYSHDHIPGAHNFPVLDDTQRAEIGTIYKQISSLEAKRRGAALVANNIAKHLQTHFADRGDDWRPLVYCWRGGMRSAALAHVLREIGWHAEQLPGGYKAYRKTVIQVLEQAAPQLRFIVLCGCTGTGKSLLLASLADAGAQVIDLEALANHRGSVLGDPVASKQPSQKHFESLLCHSLSGLNPDLPVYIEAESRRIGRIQVPTSLLEAMRAAECVRIEAAVGARTEFLIREYDHFVKDEELLRNALQTLTKHAGENKIDQWLAWQQTGKIEALVRDLLQEYYDPLYMRSMKRHFARYADAVPVRLDTINAESMSAAAYGLQKNCTPT